MDIDNDIFYDGVNFQNEIDCIWPFVKMENLTEWENQDFSALFVTVHRWRNLDL
jgi:hypothetical protein